jgi:hypothetical protein
VQKTGRQTRNGAALGAMLAAAWMTCGWAAAAAPRVDEVEAQSPTAFLPGGMLGMQPGGSWEESKRNPALQKLNCQPINTDDHQFDEVCFFHTPAASRVGGASIHDGFIVRKDDRLVLIGTGITIKDADDPLAESVVQTFQSQTHTSMQHNGDEVLFARPVARQLSAEELAGYSKRAPVLLVQLEHKANELAVLYGYLGPVNVFGALTAE